MPAANFFTSNLHAISNFLRVFFFLHTNTRLNDDDDGFQRALTLTINDNFFFSALCFARKTRTAARCLSGVLLNEPASEQMSEENFTTSPSPAQQAEQKRITNSEQKAVDQREFSPSKRMLWMAFRCSLESRNFLSN